jgi:hypothetical protein
MIDIINGRSEYLVSLSYVRIFYIIYMVLTQNNKFTNSRLITTKCIFFIMMKKKKKSNSINRIVLVIKNKTGSKNNIITICTVLK